MARDDFQIGSVVFVVRETSSGSIIVPLKIHSKTVKTTVDGTDVEHVVVYPNGKQATFPKCRIFRTPEKAKAWILEDIDKRLDSLVEAAHEAAKTFDQPIATPSVVPKKPDLTTNDVGQQSFVTLPDGTRARLVTS